VDEPRLAAARRALVSDAAPLEIVACASFQRTGVSRLHALAASFRVGDPGAFDVVLELAREALAGEDGEVGHVLGIRTAAVAVPPHVAGARNVPCERVIEALAAGLPGFRPVVGALVRIADAPEARGAASRDPAAEAATLRWDEDAIPAEADRILLLDDVVRSGATFEAVVLAAPPAVRSRLAALAIFRAEG
jgi:hypothetical protein